MRRILRKIAEGETENLGDTTTLLDPGSCGRNKKWKSLRTLYNHFLFRCPFYQIVAASSLI